MAVNAKYTPPKPSSLAVIPESTAIPAKIPTPDEIERALIASNGLITYAAEKLKCPVDVIKKQIKRYKGLRDVLMNLRDAFLDAAEDTMIYRITEKRDLIASMFVLKTIGKHRGWVEKVEKAGDSVNNPVFIKILPVDGVGHINTDKKKRGRPKALIAEAKVLPPVADTKFTDKEKALVDGKVKDFIDAEIIE